MPGVKRFHGGARRVTRRPITKEVLCVVLTSVAAAQATSVLYTATFPVTMVGLRWDLAIGGGFNALIGNYAWAIVFVPEGTGVSTLAQGNLAPIYLPEQHVIAFGRGVTSSSVPLITYNSNTKAMRKFQTGDQLVFVLSGETDPKFAEVHGAIQFFMKA